jgi:hypothetical protein
MMHSGWTIGALLNSDWSVCVQLLDIVYREETLFNVIRSVTKNGKSILLTAVLAVILIYLFSIVGFLFFQDDFLIEADVPPVKHEGPGIRVHAPDERCVVGVDCNSTESLLDMLSSIKGTFMLLLLLLL